jgi:hypothetical protein
MQPSLEEFQHKTRLEAGINYAGIIVTALIGGGLIGYFLPK